MSMFGRDNGVSESVTLALVVGQLKGEVAELRREVEALKAAKPVALPSARSEHELTPRIRSTITQMSQGVGDLVRHLEQQARAMLADNMTEADIVVAIQRGS